MMRILSGNLSATVFLVFAAVFLGCNNLEFNSHWKQAEIVIDGSHSDWENALMFSEEKRVTVGFINDEKNLYICMMAADEHILMQTLTEGFTVWFDGMGHKKEKFGIKCPLGIKMFGREMPGRDRDHRIKNPTQELLNEQSDIEIVQGDEKTRLNLTELDDYGIELKIGQHLGRFIYELKMPLYGSDSVPYSVAPKDDGTIKVGFELGKMQMRVGERRPPGNGGGFPGGSRPGGGPGMRGPRGGDRPDRPEELKIRIKVKLAKNPGI